MNDTPAEREAESTWTRLRRRKVVQWGLVYVAAAWGFLQGLEYVGEAFRWPEQLRQIAVLALVIGLPIVLVLAWYHGDRGQQRISTPELAILTLLLLLGGGAFWYYDRASDMPAGATGAAAQPAAPVATSPEAAPAPDQKSIAVLPFADMSAEKDQEYMSDGIAEELLNLLAKVPDLKVIARTSSFAFKGEKVEIAAIAKRLNVAHVLEGSVRTSGNKVRITAQLVRASDSTHLWSETYDRTLEDIFAVQDQIAKAIVEALQIRLMGGTLNRRDGGTQNLEAYQLYLRALHATNQNTASGLKTASELLEQAIKLDPGYGNALIQLGTVAGLQADNGIVSATQGYERARQLAQHVLRLNPELVGGHALLGYVYRTLDWNWAAAETEIQRALAIDPADSGTLQAAAMLSYTLGRWDDAEQKNRAALVLDPVNPYFIWSLGTIYYLSGQIAEAESTYRTLLALAPDFAWARAYLGKTLLMAGKPDEALAVVQQEADEGNRLLYLPAVLEASGRRNEAEIAQKEQIKYWADDAAFFIAQNYAYRGNHELALEWLERAYVQRDTGLGEIVGEPLFKSMLHDPRFKAFLRKMNLPEWSSKSIVATGT